MKKFLLATLLGVGALVPASAAEFSILYQDQPVENGSTIIYEGFTVVEQGYEGIDDIFYSWKVDPELYMLVDEPGTYTVHAKSLNGEAFQLCAGGDCIRGTDLPKDAIKFVLENGANEYNPLVGKPMNLQLDWAKQTINISEIQIPALEIYVEVFNNAEPSNVLSFTLHMGGFEAAGVDSVDNGSDSIIVKGNTLYYDLPAASQINVYSLSGKTVISKNVSGNGSLSLDGLSKGIYLYKVSGKFSKTSKFVIR